MSLAQTQIELQSFKTKQATLLPKIKNQRYAWEKPSGDSKH